jgi:hypothetical protein
MALATIDPDVQCMRLRSSPARYIACENSRGRSKLLRYCVSVQPDLGQVRRVFKAHRGPCQSASRHLKSKSPGKHVEDPEGQRLIL